MAEREDVELRGRRGASYAAPRAGATASPDTEEERRATELRADIERTRAEMGETVEALKEKFSSEHVKAQAKELTQQAKESALGRVKDMRSRAQGRAREMGTTIVDTVRSNPVPAAMVGLGIGWLIMKGVRSEGNGGHTAGRSDYGPGYYAPGGQIWTEEELRTGQHEQVGSGLFEEEETLRSRAEATAGQMRERAGRTAGRAREKASQLTSQAKERAGQMSDAARQQARRTKENVQDMMESNPLGVGAIALGLGALFGLLIPESSREEELMGEASGSLMEKAKETAQGVMEKAQRAASKAKEAAMEEVRQ